MSTVGVSLTGGEEDFSLAGGGDGVSSEMVMAVMWDRDLALGVTTGGALTTLKPSVMTVTFSVFVS